MRKNTKSLLKCNNLIQQCILQTNWQCSLWDRVDNNLVMKQAHTLEAMPLTTSAWSPWAEPGGQCPVLFP